MNRVELIEWLNGKDDGVLFARSAAVRRDGVGDSVYLRGLIEISNVCCKDCLYCGIGCSIDVERYTLTKAQIMESVDFAYKERFGSIVLQSGEQNSPAFVDFVEDVLLSISAQYPSLGVTISLGEQSANTYERWRNAGAHRYLLRIESSSDELYRKIHPLGYNLADRYDALAKLKKLKYQVGTGVMIGLPHQTIEHLACDLLSMQTLDIDMCGMGPYVEHSAAPLSATASPYSHEERVALTLRMIALLRIMMPSINIAATTATETLDNQGRAKSITVGANVIMPNITPNSQRLKYSLYDGKTSTIFDAADYKIEYSVRGDSIHYKG